MIVVLVFMPQIEPEIHDNRVIAPPAANRRQRSHTSETHGVVAPLYFYGASAIVPNNFDHNPVDIHELIRLSGC